MGKQANVIFRGRKITANCSDTMIEFRGGRFMWVPTNIITYREPRAGSRSKFGFVTIPESFAISKQMLPVESA